MRCYVRIARYHSADVEHDRYEVLLVAGVFSLVRPRGFRAGARAAGRMELVRVVRGECGEHRVRAGCVSWKERVICYINIRNSL